MRFPAYSEDIAGTGKVNFEDGPMHRKVLYIYAPENCFCIEITGESMFPVINKGEIISVNRDEKTLETERYYVVTYNNETFIKQILCPNEGLIVLHSHNQDFKDIYVMGENIKEIKVHGRIVKVVSEREL